MNFETRAIPLCVRCKGMMDSSNMVIPVDIKFHGDEVAQTRYRHADKEKCQQVAREIARYDEAFLEAEHTSFLDGRPIAGPRSPMLGEPFWNTGSE